MVPQAGDARDSKQSARVKFHTSMATGGRDDYPWVAELSIAKSLTATWTFFPVLPEE
jgi:Na+/proline symporter